MAETDFEIPVLNCIFKKQVLIHAAQNNKKWPNNRPYIVHFAVVTAMR